MGNEGDTHVSERSHLRGPQLLAHPSSLPSGSCLCPFLFNNTAHTHLPLPHLSARLSISPAIYLPFIFCMHIIWLYGKTKWICHHLKDFSHKKQKRHLVISCLFCPQREAPPTLHWSRCMQREHFAFLSHNAIFNAAWKNDCAFHNISFRRFIVKFNFVFIIICPCFYLFVSIELLKQLELLKSWPF